MITRRDLLAALVSGSVVAGVDQLARNKTHVFRKMGVYEYEIAGCNKFAAKCTIGSARMRLAGTAGNFRRVELWVANPRFSVQSWCDFRNEYQFDSNDPWTRHPVVLRDSLPDTQLLVRVDHVRIVEQHWVGTLDAPPDNRGVPNAFKLVGRLLDVISPEELFPDVTDTVTFVA